MVAFRQGVNNQGLPTKLDAYTEYIDRRMAEGLENCVVMHLAQAAPPAARRHDAL